MEEIAKVSHGSALDLIWTALLTIWKRKEYGLLNFTYYALKCTAGLDRKKKYIQRAYCFDWWGHLKWRKVPVFSQDHLVNIIQRRNFPVLFRKPSQTCHSERRWKNHTQIFLFGTHQNWYWWDLSPQTQPCSEEEMLGVPPSKQRPGKTEGGQLERPNRRRMRQLKRQFSFRDRKHRSTYHIAGCYSPHSPPM